MDAACHALTEPHERASVHWPLTLLPAVMVGVMMLRPIWDFDIFWQLKLGELMWDRGGLITREPFSAPHLGEALPAMSWLAQFVLAKVLALTGWQGLRLFDAVVWLGGFWAVAVAARARGASAAGLCAGLALAFLAAHGLASLRPQSFAMLCFGLLLALLRLEWPLRRTLITGAVLLVLWQNLHPSVSVAVAALGAMALPGWIGWLRDRKRPVPWAASGLAVIAAAAIFATPDGVTLMALSAHNAAEARGIGVAEWLPLWSPLNVRFAPMVLIAALAAVAVLWRSRVRLNAGEVAVLLVLGVMTAFAIRFAVFLALALVAPMGRAIADVGAGPRVHRPTMLAGAAIAAALALFVQRNPFAEQIPVAAISALERSGVAGTVFTDNYGGPLIHAGYPRWRVAYDGRYWRYTTAEWDRFRDIQHGRTGLAFIEATYRPCAMLISRALNPALVAELRSEPRRWRQVWANDQTAAFVRAVP